MTIGKAGANAKTGRPCTLKSRGPLNIKVIFAPSLMFVCTDQEILRFDVADNLVCLLPFHCSFESIVRDKFNCSMTGLKHLARIINIDDDAED